MNPRGCLTSPAALLRPRTTSCRSYQSLDGIWSFLIDDGRDHSAGFKGGQWIAVPGSWNEQVVDAERHFGGCWYQTEFFCSRVADGERLILRFDGVALSAKVWLNGEQIGQVERAFLPFGFDITALARTDDRNLLVVRVEHGLSTTRTPVGASNDEGAFHTSPPTGYDFFPFGGIIRRVRLLTVPAVHIVDLAVTPISLSPEGAVHVSCDVCDDFTGTAELSLRGRDASATLDVVNGAAQGDLSWSEFVVWAPGNPHLELLEVKLFDRGGLIDKYWTSFGLRTIQIDGSQLLLNGEPTFLKGFGRHEDFPVIGRSVSDPVIVRDTELMRWTGANSFRTSHYPYSEEALDHADRTGMLVISETSGVGLNFWEDESIVAQRFNFLNAELGELIRRDRNHPSVIAWSVANEPRVTKPGSGEAPNRDCIDLASGFLGKLIRSAKSIDPARPAFFALAQDHPNEMLVIGDIAAVNYYFGWYTQVGDLERGAAEFARKLDEIHALCSKPIIITEFGADALAGSHGTTPEMWTEEYQDMLLGHYLDVVAERPFVVGAHVWNFADFRTGQGVLRPAGLNHKGVFTRDRQPKRSAFGLRQRWRTE